MKYLVVIATDHKLVEDRRIVFDAADPKEAYSMGEKELKNQELILEIIEGSNEKTLYSFPVYHCLDGFAGDEK